MLTNCNFKTTEQELETDKQILTALHISPLELQTLIAILYDPIWKHRYINSLAVSPGEIVYPGEGLFVWWATDWDTDLGHQSLYLRRKNSCLVFRYKQYISFIPKLMYLLKLSQLLLI